MGNRIDALCRWLHLPQMFDANARPESLSSSKRGERQRGNAFAGGGNPGAGLPRFIRLPDMAATNLGKRLKSMAHLKLSRPSKPVPTPAMTAVKERGPEAAKSAAAEPPAAKGAGPSDVAKVAGGAVINPDSGKSSSPTVTPRIVPTVPTKNVMAHPGPEILFASGPNTVDPPEPHIEPRTVVEETRDVHPAKDDAGEEFDMKTSESRPSSFETLNSDDIRTANEGFRVLLKEILRAGREAGLDDDEIDTVQGFLKKSPGDRDTRWLEQVGDFSRKLIKKLQERLHSTDRTDMEEIFGFSERWAFASEGAVGRDVMMEWLGQARKLRLTPELREALEKKLSEVSRADRAEGHADTEKDWASFREFLLNEAANAILDEPDLDKKFAAVKENAGKIINDVNDAVKNGARTGLDSAEAWLINALDWPRSLENLEIIPPPLLGRVEAVLQAIDRLKNEGASPDRQNELLFEVQRLIEEIGNMTINFCDTQLRSIRQAREARLRQSRLQFEVYRQITNQWAAQVASDSDIETDDETDDPPDLKKQIVDVIDGTLLPIVSEKLKLTTNQIAGLNDVKARLENDAISPDLATGALKSLDNLGDQLKSAAASGNSEEYGASPEPDELQFFLGELERLRDILRMDELPAMGGADDDAPNSETRQRGPEEAEHELSHYLQLLNSFPPGTVGAKDVEPPMKFGEDNPFNPFLSGGASPLPEMSVPELRAYQKR